MMETTFEQLPQSGQVELTIHVSAPINYSAVAAQRIVGRFVANEIAYLLRAGEPSLVVSEQISWRVPVVLALPHKGEVGQVGSIDVSVETGAFNISPEQIQEIKNNATDRATRYSSITGPTS
jgi:hypothetical protein